MAFNQTWGKQCRRPRAAFFDVERRPTEPKSGPDQLRVSMDGGGWSEIIRNCRKYSETHSKLNDTRRYSISGKIKARCHATVVGMLKVVFASHRKYWKQTCSHTLTISLRGDSHPLVVSSSACGSCRVGVLRKGALHG